MIARLHHVSADPVQLAHRLGWPPSHDPGADDVVLAARELGLKAKLSRSTADRLSLASLPALAAMRDEQGTSRFVVLAQCDGKRALYQDPAGAIQGGRPVIEPLAVFAERWTGELILVTSRAALAGDLARFDFSWFVPSLVKYRRLFGEVLVVSLFLQLFALVSPLFFQVVMDKVLVHRGLATLDVLVIGLAVIVLFESLLTVLRSYVFSHTTSRIDVELGARLFRHLLHLPLAYFQARRVGDSVARVRELETIRSFLTGNALTLLLDVAFSVIFIAVMFFYSVPLTLIVLVTLPLYLVGRGDGVDRISAYELNSAKVDVLQMGTGIAPTDVQLLHDGASDLLVSIVGSIDSVRVVNHFMSNSKSGYQIDQIRFADGTAWNTSAIQAQARYALVPPAYDLVRPAVASADAFVEAGTGAFVSALPTVRAPSPSRKLQWEGDWVGFADLDESANLASNLASADVAAIEARVQGLIDAMASFTASSADVAPLGASHTFTVLPVLAPQYAA